MTALARTDGDSASGRPGPTRAPTGRWVGVAFVGLLLVALAAGGLRK